MKYSNTVPKSFNGMVNSSGAQHDEVVTDHLRRYIRMMMDPIPLEKLKRIFSNIIVLANFKD